MQNSHRFSSQKEKAPGLRIPHLILWHLARMLLKAGQRKSLSKLVNVNAKRIKEALGKHSKIFTGERKSWLYTERKTRGDAISEDIKQLIFHYWTHDASCPTSDKKDVMRQRVDRKEYVEHAKHVLEKSQTEAFIDFNTEYRDLQINQR